MQGAIGNSWSPMLYPHTSVLFGSDQSVIVVDWLHSDPSKSAHLFLFLSGIQTSDLPLSANWQLSRF
jgi:hypothetical protein